VWRGRVEGGFTRVSTCLCKYFQAIGLRSSDSMDSVLSSSCNPQQLPAEPTCGNLCGRPRPARGLKKEGLEIRGGRRGVASHSRQMYIIHQIKSSTALQRFASRPGLTPQLWRPVCQPWVKLIKGWLHEF